MGMRRILITAELIEDILQDGYRVHFGIDKGLSKDARLVSCEMEYRSGNRCLRLTFEDPAIDGEEDFTPQWIKYRL